MVKIFASTVFGCLLTLAMTQRESSRSQGTGDDATGDGVALRSVVAKLEHRLDALEPRPAPATLHVSPMASEPITAPQDAPGAKAGKAAHEEVVRLREERAKHEVDSLIESAMSTRVWQVTDRERFNSMLPYLGREGQRVRMRLMAAVNSGQLGIAQEMRGMPF